MIHFYNLLPTTNGETWLDQTKDKDKDKEKDKYKDKDKDSPEEARWWWWAGQNGGAGHQEAETHQHPPTYHPILDGINPNLVADSFYIT